MKRKPLVELTDEQRALMGPIELKPRDSSEYAYQYTFLLQIKYQSATIGREEFDKLIAEGKSQETHRYHPQYGISFTTWDEYMVWAIGKDEKEAKKDVEARELEKRGGDRKSAEYQQQRQDQVGITNLKKGNKERSYYLARLNRDAPELYDRVKSGELSANAAAIEAGFRIKSITVPLDVERAARVLRKSFNGQLEALIEALKA